MTDPDTIASAVLRHIDAAEKSDGIPQPAPTDGEVFDGVPEEIPEVPTAPMRIPHDLIPNPFDSGDDWEQVDEDAETVVRQVPRLRPHDPTGCMM